MEYSIQEIGGSSIEISFSLGKENWNECIQEAYEKNKHKYKIEGFRAGKVPFKLLVNRYGLEIFFEEAIDLAINKYYQEILQKEEKYDPLKSPEVDVKTISEEGMSAILTVQVYPLFDLGQYKDLTIQAVKTEVTDEQIDSEIKKVQETHARWVGIDDRGIKVGDRILFNYEGYIGDEKFEGGSAEGATLDIGSGQFIPGFEEKLVGAKVEEELDVEVTFPEDYHSEAHAGKKAVFKCKVLEIKEKQLPLIDDEFAKDLGDYETLAEYREKLKLSLEEKASEKDKVQEENSLIDNISKNTDIVIPEVLIEQELDRLVEDFSLRLTYSGLKFQDYLNYLGTDLVSFKNEHKEEAKESVKVRLILEAIIKKEDINVEKEEVDAELKTIADKEGKEFEEFTKDIKEEQIMRIMNKVLSDKLFGFLRNNNTFEK